MNFDYYKQWTCILVSDFRVISSPKYHSGDDGSVKFLSETWNQANLGRCSKEYHFELSYLFIEHIEGGTLDELEMVDRVLGELLVELEMVDRVLGELLVELEMVELHPALLGFLALGVLELGAIEVLFWYVVGFDDSSEDDLRFVASEGVRFFTWKYWFWEIFFKYNWKLN